MSTSNMPVKKESLNLDKLSEILIDHICITFTYITLTTYRMLPQLFSTELDTSASINFLKRRFSVFAEMLFIRFFLKGSISVRKPYI
ncbi:unnamed protein product [Gordionus sp. m RMFG-2023]